MICYVCSNPSIPSTLVCLQHIKKINFGLEYATALALQRFSIELMPWSNLEGLRQTLRGQSLPDGEEMARRIRLRIDFASLPEEAAPQEPFREFLLESL